ncbi:MAG TPA: PQQ-binding-like beta-propeller repeat protein, partial [Actinomycetota bacterium]|nr:PQQ-binding-like beta-propeller repeat protein [Actinomycetota bacterium]
MPSGQATAPYRLSLKATGGTTPYAWSIESGSLPAGLQLSSPGLITGTFSAIGSSSVTVRVHDKAGDAVSKTLAWKVVAMTTWTMDGRDAGHSMRNLSEVSLRPDNVTSLKREWTADNFFVTSSVSTPAVDASGVHVARSTSDTAEGVLDVLDPARGKVLSEIRSAVDAPNIAGGLIVVRDPSGHLQAYDHATHALLWSTEQNEATARLSAPVIDGTTVFARGSTGNEAALYAFNAATGARRWKVVLSAGGGAGYFTPSVGGGNVYVTDGTGSVQARSEQ